VTVVAFDKTGTITTGQAEVLAIAPVGGVSEELLLQTAAIAERRSEHPLAKAIVRRAEQRGLTRVEPDGFAYFPGRGVVAELAGERIVAGNRALLQEEHAPEPDGNHARNGLMGSSEVVVARGGKLLGTIYVADQVRVEAHEAIRALKGMDIRTILLTGDSRVAAESVGGELEIEAIAAELLPEDKVRFITRMGAGGRGVAMVGDGVNDAPALAQATVGVAMGSGTDVARESADVVLLGNDLRKLVETIHIARRAHGIIRFNFAGTLAVDAIGVGLAAVGLLNPVLAALIHVASELAFILNSARLLPNTRRVHA
jgi:Cd2+/Zn2+-exporting ATPase/Cu+-exporting ATPase